MSDNYENVVVRKLKLKKQGDVAQPDKKRRSKKRKSDPEPQAQAPRHNSDSDNDNGEEWRKDPKYKHMTAAEYRYEIERQKREREQMKKLAQTTHRERIKELNDKLDALPEHFDLPKVALTIG